MCADSRPKLFTIPEPPSPDYNVLVATPAPNKPVPDEKHHHRHPIYAAEATGLLVMAVLLLVLILIRYWSNIPWNAH
jgi:hypothetical protein